MTKADYSVAKEFCDGKVEQKFFIMAQAVKSFIDAVTPQLETINILLNQEFALPLKDIDGNKTKAMTKTNITEAKKFLSLYNRTFGQIDLHLGLMTSNITLPLFIKDCGLEFSNEEMYKVMVIIQPEIRAYWDSTYGMLTEKFNKIRDDLMHLRDTLEEEIALLESLSTTPYYEGIEKNLRALELFQEERAIFWGNLVKDAQISDDEIKVVEGIFAGHRKKLNSIISAHIEITKGGVKRDMAQTEGGVRKALLVFTYILGVLKTLYTLKKILISTGGKKISGYVFSFIFPKPEKDLAKLTVISQNALKDLGSNNLESLAGML